MQVEIANNNGWYSSYNVKDSDGHLVVVKTVDIYTYMCTGCDNKLECQHVESVEAYVEKKLDEYMKNREKQSENL